MRRGREPEREREREKGPCRREEGFEIGVA
jgi:hypothetical protein